jgi:molybdenum cofactor cytidylyltransferase
MPVKTGGKSRAIYEAIVLAAGAGSRFGGGKLLASWRGRPLIEGSLAAAFAAPSRAVTLVVGADADVGPAAQAYADRTGLASRLRIVVAPDHARGMSASLHAALRVLPTDVGAVFVFLGDMPAIPTSLPARLVAALEGADATPGERHSDAKAAAPVRGGRRGHPVLFRASLFGAMAAIEGDRGARDLLDALNGELLLVETEDDGVLFDVDTPEALQGGVRS